MPVACFVFAVLGLALGASNRKDGKLAAFVLGIGVIFAYYVIMFTGAGADQGLLDSGVAVDVDAEHRARRRRRVAADLARALGRSADSHPAAARGSAGSGKRDAGDAAAMAPRRRRRPAAAALSSSACRTSSCRARRCSTSTSRKQYLRILAMTTVGLLGLFYISTFIDMSDKLFKGQATHRHDRRVPVLVDAGIPVLHHRARGAARRRW